MGLMYTAQGLGRVIYPLWGEYRILISADIPVACMYCGLFFLQAQFVYYFKKRLYHVMYALHIATHYCICFCTQSMLRMKRLISIPTYR